METYIDFFKEKRVTVMGLGLLGGLGDIRFLAERCADLVVTDLKSEKELRPSLDVLRAFPNIRYTLGRHELEDFKNRDLIIQAPSTPSSSLYLAEARAQKIPITMWAALFARFARRVGAPIVGVTGTRGKTTTAALITHILRTAGRHVIEGGNIPGSSMLPRLPELTQKTTVVLELDSWKIQGFREEGISPNVGVFTTFYPDHLDYYRGDLKMPKAYGQAMDAYLADKAEIFLHQNPHDTLILGEQAALLVEEKYAGRIVSHIDIAHSENVPQDWNIAIPGRHNRANISCALHAARALGINDETTKIAVELFAGVPGRLEMVRELNGVKIYNDTTATTPEATIAALNALDPQGKRNIVLIAGGTDKGLDMSAMRPAVHAHCKKVVFLSGTGTEKIHSHSPDTPVFGSLKEAIAAAWDAAAPEDILLFSPAFASFGMFKNEYDRGEQFNVLIRNL